MADRTFTEGEAYALVADAVERETAAARTEASEAKEQVTLLGNEKDALELRAKAAEDAAEAAKKELEDFKESVETQKAQEAKREERTKALADVAPQLKVEGERAERIVAMADADFIDYVESLREVAAQNAHGFKAEGDDSKECGVCGKPSADALHNKVTQKAAVEGELPRQSAAFKGGDPGSAPKGAVSTLFAAREALRTKTTA